MTLYRNYVAHGQEVLRDGKHVADTTDPDMARLIAEALNHAPDCCDPLRTGTPEPSPWFHPEPEDDTGFPELADAPALVEDHFIQRQGDEFACKCGVRWEASDGEEHP